MKKTRFQEMVSALQKENIKRFTELVDSPYFNKNERVKRLWKWVLENPKAEYSKEELRKAVLADNISVEQNSGITEANFRMVLSDFVKLAELFLLLEENELIDTQRDSLIDILKTKGAEKSYRKHILLTKEKVKDETNKDTEYYNLLYMLECEVLSGGNRKKLNESLEKINTLTDNIWMCMKLDGYIKSSALGIDVKQMTFYNEIIAIIESNKDTYRKKHPVIYSRYLAVRMFENNKSTEENTYYGELDKYTVKLKDKVLQKNNYEAMIVYSRLKEDHEMESALIRKLEKIVK